MKITKALPQLGIILFFIIALSSCEEDFNTIGVDIIGDEINNVNATVFPVIAYSKKIDTIETNNLPSYRLGVYNDPIYGMSTADVVSQVLMPTGNPTFGETGDDAFPVVVDSVFIYVPYFSNVTTTDDVSTFTLDSIFGNNPIDLTIYESNYFLRDFDPDSNFEDPQKYYSNLGEVFDIEANRGETLFQIEDFVPENKGFILTRIGDDGIEENLTLSPGIRAELPQEFFQEKIIDKQGDPELLTNSTFKEYFRGIVFDAEAINGLGNQFLFDFADANITVYYGYNKEVTDVNDSDDDGDTSDTVIEKQNEEFVLSFNGINANMLSGEDQINFINPDIVNGEENLYLRGGDGYVTVIELFQGDSDGNGINDLEDLRESEMLINEANLIFYVDQNQVSGGSAEPDRVLIYDLNNERVLADYSFDLTQGELPGNAFNQHLGILERGSDDNGDYYKIKITNHLNNVINKDSTNVSLGLVVSQNVAQGGFQDLPTTNGPIKSIPSSCVIAPEGTVLHGNLSPIEEKKLVLRLYDTDPN